MCQNRHSANARARPPARVAGRDRGARAPPGGCRARPRCGRASARRGRRRGRRAVGSRSPPRARGTPSRGARAGRPPRRAPRAARAAYSRIVSSIVNRDVAVRVVADPDEALLGQPLEAVEHVERPLVAGDPAHASRPSSSGAAAREHAEAREQRAGPRRRAGRGSSRSRRAASAGAPAGRAPPADSSPSRSPRRAAIAAGREEPDPRRGELDRERQAVEPADDLGDVRRVLGRQREVRAGRPAPARRTARTASDCHERRPRSDAAGAAATSGGTGNSCSPEIRSGARLVTMTVSFGRRRSRSATTGAPATTCSKLSRTSSAVRSPEVLDDALDRASAAGASSAEGRGDRRRDEVRVGDRGERHEPDAVGEAGRAARPRAASESRVLPVPPGPVSVSSRRPVQQRRPPPSTSARPTKVVSCGGRLLGVRVERRGAAGTSSSSPSASTWYRRSGAREVLEPVLAEVAAARRPAPDPPARSARRVRERATWPPCAAARDARGPVDLEADVVARRRPAPRRCGGPSGRGRRRRPATAWAASARWAATRRADRRRGRRERRRRTRRPRCRTRRRPAPRRRPARCARCAASALP